MEKINKDHLKRMIAQSAYNIGFGAKKTLATYDIIEKVPGLITFFSFLVGILGLFIDFFAEKQISALFIIFGIACLYMNMYDSGKDEYAKTGSEMILLFNELKMLYLSVAGSSDNTFTTEVQKLREIEDKFNKISIKKQVIFSGWYAHFKFFYEHQIDWIDNELKFTIKDKIPASLKLIILIVICIIIILFIKAIF